MKRKIHTLPVRSNLPQLPGPLAGLVAIDVLRASTTAAVALSAGARAIHPCASREEATERRQQLRRQGIVPLMCGERGGSKIEGYDLGNSPREFTPERIQSATLIMTTTNGTKALREAEERKDGRPGMIAFGAYINAGAVAERLISLDGDVALVCSGKFGLYSSEDFVGAGLIVHEMLQRSSVDKWELDDASRSAYRLFQQHRDFLLQLLQTCSHGAYLIECGFGDDLPICAKVNSSNVVPVYSGGVLRG